MYQGEHTVYKNSAVFLFLKVDKCFLNLLFSKLGFFFKYFFLKLVIRILNVLAKDVAL